MDIMAAIPYEENDFSDAFDWDNGAITDVISLISCDSLLFKFCKPFLNL